MAGVIVEISQLGDVELEGAWYFLAIVSTLMTWKWAAQEVCAVRTSASVRMESRS